MRGLRRNSGWTWFWAARRARSVDWHEATTPAEAIRRPILLRADNPPAWLRETAATAEQQVLDDHPTAPDNASEDDGSRSRA